MSDFFRYVKGSGLCRLIRVMGSGSRLGWREGSWFKVIRFSDTRNLMESGMFLFSSSGNHLEHRAPVTDVSLQGRRLQFLAVAELFHS